VLDLRRLAEATGEQVRHQRELGDVVGLVHRDHEPAHPDGMAAEAFDVLRDIPAFFLVVIEISQIFDG
jgi:hypothetical protein